MEIELVLELGYTNEDILMVKDHQRMSSYTDSTLYAKMIMIYYFLIEFGFNKTEVLSITRTFNGIFSYEIKTLETKINKLMIIGFTKEDIKKMIKENPKVLSVGINNIESKIKFMEELGYKHEEVIKLAKRNSSIFENGKDTIMKKIKDMMGLGYSYLQVIKISKKEALVYKYDIDYIRGRIEDIVELGFTYQEVLSMFCRFPSVIDISLITMKKKCDQLIEIGFSREEILMMINKLPTVFGSDVEKIRIKKVFMDSIGLNDVYIKDPLQLMQSVEVSYARYKFFEFIGIEINMDNYRLLFMNEKRFVKRYGITKEELMMRYKYDENYGNDKKKTLE